MDRLPLRLLAFVLGPLVTKRAAEAGLKRELGGASRRASSVLRAEPSAEQADEAASLRMAEAQKAREARESVPETPMWLWASVGLAALVATGVAVSGDDDAVFSSRKAGAKNEAGATEPARDKARDFGGV